MIERDRNTAWNCQNPISSDIAARSELYAGGYLNWSVVAAKSETARPFKIAESIFSMILITGQALTCIYNGKLLQPFLQDHGNPNLSLSCTVVRLKRCLNTQGDMSVCWSRLQTHVSKWSASPNRAR